MPTEIRLSLQLLLALQVQLQVTPAPSYEDFEIRKSCAIHRPVTGPSMRDEMMRTHHLIPHTHRKVHVFSGTKNNT